VIYHRLFDEVFRVFDCQNFLKRPFRIKPMKFEMNDHEKNVKLYAKLIIITIGSAIATVAIRRSIAIIVARRSSIIAIIIGIIAISVRRSSSWTITIIATITATVPIDTAHITSRGR